MEKKSVPTKCFKNKDPFYNELRLWETDDIDGTLYFDEHIIVDNNDEINNYNVKINYFPKEDVDNTNCNSFGFNENYATFSQELKTETKVINRLQEDIQEIHKNICKVLLNSDNENSEQQQSRKYLIK